MSCPSVITINRTDCIGNSRTTINSNFTEVVDAVCDNDSRITALEGVNVISILPAGSVIQTQQSVLTTTTLYQPYFMSASTTPQITSGVELLSLTITPNLPNSRFLIHAQPVYSSNGTYTIAVCGLFRTGVSNALIAKQHYADLCEDYMHYVDAPAINNTSPITYSLRVGTHNGSSVNLNDIAPGAQAGLLGSARMSVLIVQEIKS